MAVKYAHVSEEIARGDLSIRKSDKSVNRETFNGARDGQEIVSGLTRVQNGQPLPTPERDRVTSEARIRPGVYWSQDGKSWDFFGDSFDSLLQAEKIHPYVATFDSDNRRTLRKSPAKQRAAAASNYDIKIGRVGLHAKQPYKLCMKKSGSMRYEVTRNVIGETVLSNIVAMDREHGNRKHSFKLMDDGVPIDLSRDAIDQALIAAKLVAAPVTPDFTSGAIVQAKHWYDRTFTWFTLEVDGKPIADAASMRALLGDHYMTIAKQQFGKGAIRWSDKRSAWCLPDLRVDPETFDKWLNSPEFKPNVKHADVLALPEQDTSIKPDAKSVDPVGPTNAAPTPTVDIAQQLAALTQQLAALQAMIAK